MRSAPAGSSRVSTMRSSVCPSMSPRSSPRKLATGEHAGQDAEVTVTVRSIKERELPEPDDEFAQLASEFDTIDELRDSLREQVRMIKRAQQAEQIRNATFDALLEQVEVPLPEAIVQAQFDSRHPRRLARP